MGYCNTWHWSPRGEKRTGEPRWYFWYIPLCSMISLGSTCFSPLLPHCCSWQVSGEPAQGDRDVEGACESRFVCICHDLPDQWENHGTSIYFSTISQGSGSFKCQNSSFPRLKAGGYPFWRTKASAPQMYLAGFPTFGFPSYLASTLYARGVSEGSEGLWIHIQLCKLFVCRFIEQLEFFHSSYLIIADLIQSTSESFQLTTEV